MVIGFRKCPGRDIPVHYIPLRKQEAYSRNRGIVPYGCSAFSRRLSPLFPDRNSDATRIPRQRLPAQRICPITAARNRLTVSRLPDFLLASKLLCIRQRLRQVTREGRGVHDGQDSTGN